MVVVVVVCFKLSYGDKMKKHFNFFHGGKKSFLVGMSIFSTEGKNRSWWECQFFPRREKINKPNPKYIPNA